jgi:hypothetical protein
MYKYVALVTGPKEYLKEEVLIETFEITQEEIDDCRESEESDEQVIEYIIEDYNNGWEQRWCRAQVFTLSQYRIVDPFFEWKIGPDFTESR